jgi:O-antigen ligase
LRNIATPSRINAPKRIRFFGRDLRGSSLVAAFVPAAFTVYAGFNAGGFFAGTPALLAVVAGLALVARITLAELPFAGFGRLLAAASVALGLYAAWALVSAFWSDAPARALIEFDRALLYWLVLVLMGSFASGPGRLAMATRGVMVGMLVVCGAGLASRLLPELIEVAPAVAGRRLSFPLTYWNALGLMAAIGSVLSLHLAASEREPWPWRVAGSGALPVFAATLYFTFSRGAIVVAVAAALVYIVMARPRALPFALLSAGVATAVSVLTSYDADLLAGDDPTGAAAAAQGEEVALVVVACVIGAALVRAALLPLDRRVSRIDLAPATRRSVLLGTGAVVALSVVIAALALDAPGRVSDFVDGFGERGAPRSDDLRGRLTDPGNNGRIKQWEIALEAFSRAPLLGEGAGTYGQLWARHRDRDLKVEDAHSLYVESLGELGLPGLVLILVTLGCLLVGLAVRARGASRHLHAAVLAAALAWAVHAGIDWDWEMPAVTLWVFGLGGLALAALPERGLFHAPARFTRVVLGVAVLALVLPAALMAVSQRELNRSAEALGRGDCTSSIDAALAASQAMPVRPEPLELLGYCDVRAGRPDLAIRLMEASVDRDPNRWQAYYGLAIARARLGQDPRPAARRALELNPRGDLALDAVRRFRGNDPRKWKRRAATARLPAL